MSNTARKLLEGVLKLGLKERARLAAEIIASLDGPADPEASKAWDEEIQRRADAYFSGTIAELPETVRTFELPKGPRKTKKRDFGGAPGDWWRRMSPIDFPLFSAS